MENCLLTKLKASVDNPNLPNLYNYTFDILSGVGTKTPAQVASSFSIGGTDVSIEVNESRTKATIYNFRNLTKFEQYNGIGVGLDLNELCMGGLITKLNITQTGSGTAQTYNITGDVSQLPTSLTYVVFPYLEFDIKELGHLTSLANLPFATNNTNSVFANISGSVEEFVQAQITAGRTSGGTRGVLYGSNGVTSTPIVGSVTFNNNVITQPTKQIKWNWDGTSANITLTDWV